MKLLIDEWHVCVVEERYRQNVLLKDLLFYAATLCLLSMNSDFNNSTYMYILPHLPRSTGAPAH